MRSEQLDAVLCGLGESLHAFPWEGGSGEPSALALPPESGFDSLSRWRRSLGPEGLGLGVYYDELAGGMLEFLSVGGWDERAGGSAGA